MSQPDRAVAPASRVASAVARDGQHARQRARQDAIERTSLAPLDEVLVVDDRWEVRPAQAVESKLTRMLNDATLPVSHLQMRGLLRNR